MRVGPESMPWPERVIRRFLVSRPGIWYGRYILPYLDVPLLRFSRGRWSMSPGQPILLLATTGAKTGKRRFTPVVYVRNNNQVVVIASNGGRDYHPGWYYNLSNHPAATVYLDGQVRRYQARLVVGDERAALWQQALSYFDGFAYYEQRTTRPIPIFVLTPQEAPR